MARPRSIVELLCSVQSYQVLLAGFLSGIALIIGSIFLGIDFWTASEPRFAAKTREVGYFAAVNWSVTYLVLSPALMYMVTNTVSSIETALDRLHERDMVRKSDMEVAQDHALTLLWKIGTRGRAYFLFICAGILPVSAGLSEWFTNNLLRLFHLGALPSQSDYDWGLAGVMAEPEWSVGARVANAAFDLLAFLNEIALSGVLVAFFIVVLDLDRVLSRAQDFVLLPDLRPGSKDPRLGFEVFVHPLEQLLSVALLTYLICYSVRLEGAYMASTAHSSLAEFVRDDILFGVTHFAKGDTVETFTHLLDPGALRLRGVLAWMLSLLIAIASVATVVITVRGAARTAKDNALNALRRGSLGGTSRQKAATQKKLEGMVFWPFGHLRYLKLNMLIVWIVVAIVTLFFYRIGLFAAGLVCAVLFARLFGSVKKLGRPD